MIGKQVGFLALVAIVVPLALLVFWSSLPGAAAHGDAYSHCNADPHRHAVSHAVADAYEDAYSHADRHSHTVSHAASHRHRHAHADGHDAGGEPADRIARQRI